MNKIVKVFGGKVGALVSIAASILLILPLMTMADERVIDTQDYTPENTFVMAMPKGQR